MLAEHVSCAGRLKLWYFITAVPYRIHWAYSGYLTRISETRIVKLR